jgi:D-inositol-3-phosphate glycosyltransferase
MVSYHTCPGLAPGAGKVGGMNVYVRELSRNLGAMGMQVDILTRRHKGQNQDVVSLGDNVRIVHIDGGPEDTDLDGLYPWVHHFAQRIFDFQGRNGIRYDLVHAHYWMSGLVGQCLSRRDKAPMVMTFHTLAELKKRARPGEKEPPYRTAIEKQLLSRASAVTASSQHEIEAMVNLYQANRDKTKLVYCGVDLSLFKPLDMKEARHRLGLNGEKVLLYVGRIEALKGVDLLLRIAATMEAEDRIKVLIVGGDLSQDKEVQRLKSLSEEMGISNRVKFIGRVDRELLPTYFSAADICVVPSYYESFGLVALESMACGTPVVAARVGGLPTVVKHGQTGYLLPWRCPEPYADALSIVLRNDDLRRTMSQAALERASCMGWDRVASKVAGIYDRLVGRTS